MIEILRKCNLPCDVGLVSELRIEFGDFLAINTLELGEDVLTGIGDVLFHHGLGDGFFGSGLFLGNECGFDTLFEVLVIGVFGDERVVFDVTIHHKSSL